MPWCLFHVNCLKKSYYKAKLNLLSSETEKRKCLHETQRLYKTSETLKTSICWDRNRCCWSNWVSWTCLLLFYTLTNGSLRLWLDRNFRICWNDTGLRTRPGCARERTRMTERGRSCVNWGCVTANIHFRQTAVRWRHQLLLAWSK